MQKVAILGSTGSIGRNTLDVVDRLAPRFQVIAISGGTNIELIAEQTARYKPEIVSVATDQHAKELVKRLQGLNVGMPTIKTGMEGMLAVATHSEAEIVVSATVGALGLLPTYKAIELGRRVAIANKEPFVMAGQLMQKCAQENGAEILPVDSEHNALHQCLRGERFSEVVRLILTASGGPFRNATLEEMQQATVAQAIKHPTWQMGAKITIDSATMMNKGLEVIEARWLFGFTADQIDIVIHPQSVVHSMIELVDGSFLAQMGLTDMRLPIQYAMTYPDRLVLDLPRLNLTNLQKLEFFAPDESRFPAISLAYKALRLGGIAPTVLNAANEVAVARFLDGSIGFMDIPRVIDNALSSCEKQGVGNLSSIEDALTADAKTRLWAEDFILELNSLTVGKSN
ncbi:MAG: 1-deoxy-D-xylulose-5-phosphate reductoisomerase [Blastocatellia bacterium]|nr:1-deoxy-D-xylulose-5-phosphate reductoisomerase [Blastocatellia bacterium]